MRGLALVFSALALAACGEDSEPTRALPPEPTPGAAVDATAPTPTPKAAETPEATPSALPTAQGTPPPEFGEGGAGDERPPITGLKLTVDADGLAPRRLQAQAFFPLIVTVENRTGEQVNVAVTNEDGERVGGGGGDDREFRFVVPAPQPGILRVDAGAGRKALIQVNRSNR